VIRQVERGARNHHLAINHNPSKKKSGYLATNTNHEISTISRNSEADGPPPQA
jgi:hypothetical protein